MSATATSRDDLLPAKITAAIGIFCQIAALVSVIYWALTWPHDSTDGPDGRSGMILHVDNATGCHYLSTFLGGITPRLDANGSHVCTGQEDPEDGVE